MARVNVKHVDGAFTQEGHRRAAAVPAPMEHLGVAKIICNSIDRLPTTRSEFAAAAPVVLP